MHIQQMTKMRLNLSLAVLSLAGCANVYQAPTGANTATIEYRNESPYRMSVEIYKSSDRCTNRSMLIPLVESQSSRLTTVTTEKDVSFTVGQDHGSEFNGVERVIHGCLSTITFKPQNGHKYLYRHALVETKCKYQLLDVSANDGSTIPASFIKRERVTPFDDSGSFCKAVN